MCCVILNVSEVEWHEDDEHPGAFLPVNVSSESETKILDGLLVGNWLPF